MKKSNYYQTKHDCSQVFLVFAIRFVALLVLTNQQVSELKRNNWKLRNSLH